MRDLSGDIYEIRIREPIDVDWCEWFDGISISQTEEQGTTIQVKVRDQTALHGLLSKIGRLNLTLLSVRKIDREE